MAIQQINLGSAPSGAGGDTQRAANTKINQNFSNSAHAASRLVGTAEGNVAEYNGDGISNTGIGGRSTPFINKATSIEDMFTKLDVNKFLYFINNGNIATNLLPVTGFSIGVGLMGGGDKALFLISTDGSRAGYLTRTSGGSISTATFYTTKNTTKDTATGFLKTSSPVLHVYNDSITKIHEAEQLDIVVDKKGVGHYEIHGTTGLRKNDGWFMSPPRDVHGNVLCMVDLEEKDGVVILRTYKKKFDFETVSIMHDWDNPMDIPDGVCVEFRFNDLPEEQLDEPIE